jgi:DNA-binding NarL/FixJ family response regulator
MDQKILIVDAHPVYIYKTEGFLKGLTFRNIILSSSGKDGIEAAQVHDPALVILSGMLPDVPSEQVCEAIKKGSPTAKIIVQVGLFTEANHIASLKAAGADSVLARKEKDLMPFQKAIEELLQCHHM